MQQLTAALECLGGFPVEKAFLTQISGREMKNRKLLGLGPGG